VPPLGIELSSRFKSQVRALPADRFGQVAQAMAQLSDAFGKPHLHSGLGIRRLKKNYYEFRAGRDTRVVFKLEGSTATLVMAGNHDDVRRCLKPLSLDSDLVGPGVGVRQLRGWSKKAES